MKKTYFLLLFLCFSSCAELQQIADSLPQEPVGVTNTEVAAGLRQALQLGIDRQVSQLTEEGGFFTNELVRIHLPPELQKVDASLRKFGLEELADQGLRVLNRAAEEGVKKATPIFVDAVRDISFADARKILLGDDSAATDYLANRTSDALYAEFNPVIQSSLDEVGANEVWSNIIQKYNALPMTQNVNPDLTDYVTQEALEGVFVMIAVEEKEIRNNFAARTSDLLRRVFGLQDGY